LFEDPKQDCGATDTTAGAPITVVQTNAVGPSNTLTAVAPFALPQQQGDTVVVMVATPNGPVMSLTDTSGNSYTMAGGPQGGSHLSIYVASNIAAAAAGANIMTVKQTISGQLDVVVLEYSGLVTAAPLDTKVGATGAASTTADSGPIVTANAHDVLVAAVFAYTPVTAPGPGFVNEGTTPDGELLEDRVVMSAGTYDASAMLQTLANWDVVVAALRGS
jgi:hypothetical protein